jgi:tRNA A-37 threonylcarbamoyl transferase component Bud32
MDGPSSPGGPTLAARRESTDTAEAAFRAELDAFLQRRLRLVVGWLCLAAVALFVVSRVLDVLNRGAAGARHLHPAVLAHAGACLVALAVWARLSRRRLGGAALLVADALIVEAVIGFCLLVLVFAYEEGMRQQVAILGLLLVARAVVVPSSALRTFLLSAPAPLGLLLIQFAFGRAYTHDGELHPQAGFPSHVAWNQVVLWLSVLLATATSHVQYVLRARVARAAQLDRYLLEGRIGAGAMGEVYRARHALIQRPAAVKVLRPELMGEEGLARFEQEVRLTCRLSHPNTVSVFDFGRTVDGRFYYAMEYLDGADLESIVEATGPFPPSRVIHVLQQAAASLAEAHAAGLVHRDVKPANVMLCRRAGEADVVKVTDFGLAREVRTGAAGPEALAGTPLTMAPEVIRGRPAGPASDLYALGVVGCWLLTGMPVFDATSVADHLRSHLVEPPVPPSRRREGVPADLDACLLRCLAKDPDERPAGAAALRRDLASLADAGRWTAEDAAAWWAAHGDRLAGPLPA